MQLATAEAAVRLKQTGAPVASIFGLSGQRTLDDTPETARLASLLTDLHWRAGLELFRDGVLHIPSLEPIERPDLAGSFDMIGFSFYATVGIRGGKMIPYPTDAPVSPLGYGIWADGLRDVLDRLNEMVPDTPLLVAEYGIDTDDDRQRVSYLERGLQVTNEAISRASTYGVSSTGRPPATTNGSTGTTSSSGSSTAIATSASALRCSSERRPDEPTRRVLIARSVRTPRRPDG